MLTYIRWLSTRAVRKGYRGCVLEQMLPIVREADERVVHSLPPERRMATRSVGSVTSGLPRKIHPPNLSPKAMVFAAIRGLTATAFIAPPIVFAADSNNGYRGE